MDCDNTHQYLKKSFQNVKESPTLEIALKQRMIGSDKLIKFGFGQSPFPIYKPLVEKLKTTAHVHYYAPTQGDLNLRTEIANWIERNYDVKFSPQNIIITPGSKFAIYTSMMVFNGEIVLPDPSWVSYAPQCRLAQNKEPHVVFTKKENKYFPTSQDYKDSFSDKNVNKFTIINSPNNPTGQIMTENQMKELAKYFRNNRYVVLSDEIYCHLSYDLKKYKSFAKFYKEGTLVSGGVSKWGNAGGWRLGYLAVPDELSYMVKPIVSVLSETVSCAPTPIQLASIEAFKQNSDLENNLDKMIKILEASGKHLASNLRGLGLDCEDPAGGFYIMPSFNNLRDLLNKKGIKTSQQLTDLIFEKYQISLLAGIHFLRPETELCFRLSFTDFDGEAVLQQALKPNTKINFEFLKKNCPKILQASERFRKLVDWLKE